jgi:hypothetical protein
MKEFKTRESFISQTRHIGDQESTGLGFYNCECESTLTIEIFEGSKELARQKRLEARKNKLNAATA